jgi:hypothetical protein
MTSRNSGVELFRIFALCDAHQYHLLGVQGFYNIPSGTVYETYLTFVLSALTYSMTGWFQVGTLFLIGRPFRLRGLLCFCLSINFYSRALALLFRALGIANLTADFTVRFPILRQQSWFFTAHTILTLIAPVLHPGMLALSASAYALADLGILTVLSVCEPGGPVVFSAFHGPGMNWMNAVMLYFFAGFFALHGRPWPALALWAAFGAAAAAAFVCTRRPVDHFLPPRWRWLAQSLRLTFWRTRAKMKWRDGFSRCYISPLAFVAGVAAIHAARAIPVPRASACALAFLGPKVYVLHFLDSTPMANWVRWFWFRVPERQATPKECLHAALLVTAQMAIAGFVMEMCKEWLFGVVSARCAWLYAVGKPVVAAVKRKSQEIGERIRSRRTVVNVD